MSDKFPIAVVQWAARDVLRRPGESALLALAILSTICVLAVPLLLTQATSATVSRILAGSPDLVLRKVNAVGWTPIPEETARKTAASVRGITDAETRIWGVVQGPSAPVTVVGVRADRSMQPILPALPLPGQAVVGPGVGGVEKPADFIELRGRRTQRLEVIAVLDADFAMAAQDLVFVSVEDARQLLGLPPGYASDLALRVFNPQEAEAVLSDLAAAFSWPVQITTRSEAAGVFAAAMARRGAVSTLAAIPCLLAVGLLVLAVVRQHLGRRHEIGLLKSLGWTAGDIVRVQMLRALIIGVPAAVTGLLFASLLVFWPGITWPARLLLGWHSAPPHLVLSGDGAALILLLTAGLVLLPFLTATLVPAVKSAAFDPMDLLEREMS